MAKPARYRAYSATGEIVDSGTISSGAASVTPQGADAVLVVFYSGKLADEVVAGSAEVRIPVGVSMGVAFSG